MFKSDQISSIRMTTKSATLAPKEPQVPSKGHMLVGKGLKTLKGIEFPPNITTLDVSHNSLRNLIGCPPGITDLFCYDNELTDFTGVPAGLIRIDAHSNPIRTTKGLEVCANLKDVTLYMCELTELGGFPNSVEELNVAKNMISKILEVPTSCKTLGITCNRLPDECVDKTVDQLREMLSKGLKVSE